jgi:glycosyltransferase involved in cell wall biosynthesis
MRVVHLTASTFFGGPERQIVGLAEALRPATDTHVLLFDEAGRHAAFRRELLGRGFRAEVLTHDTPRFGRVVGELAGRLRDLGAGVLLCHGYKANLLGRPAGQRAGVPAVAVSRGWTGESWKVRLYETADRLHLRYMDRVVCVSDGQAAKVRRCGVDDGRLSVIRNAARPIGGDPHSGATASARRDLQRLLPSPGERLVVAAGRLSPEKGFGVLVEAAVRVCRADAGARFLHFGDGVLHDTIRRQIERHGLSDRFVLGGLRDDLDRLWPAADLTVLPSFTEGLPNVLLEAASAGVAAVATAVGGTPEVVADGETGLLVPPGDPAALGEAITALLSDAERRRAMGDAARRWAREHFTFAAQAKAYRRLFAELGVAGAA